MMDIDESYGVGPDEDDEPAPIMDYEMDRLDRQDHWDNAMEDRRISNQ